MLNSLKKFFSNSKNENEQTDMNPAIAASALMIQAAHADGDYAIDERHKIHQILSEGFKLGPDQAELTLKDAEARVEDAIDHHQFTRIVKSMPKNQRLTVMTHLWMVVLADGQRDDNEDALLRRLGPLLALSDHERAKARHLAERLVIDKPT